MSSATPADFERITTLVARDPGDRGIAPLLVPGDLEAAVEALAAASRVVIVSGFFIPAANACETDGPPGVWAVREALRALGKEVLIATDTPCTLAFGAAGLEPDFCFDPEAEAAAVAATVEEQGPAAWLAIERVGPGADGKCHNMRGVDITPHTAPLHALFDAARLVGQPTIGVGDGGNEIGMGKVAERVAASVPLGAAIGCRVPCDHLVVAGTSNWGAWGLVAGLALKIGRPLLPTREEADAVLERCVAAGMVDGVTHRRAPTVDGLAPQHHAELLLALQGACHDV